MDRRASTAAGLDRLLRCDEAALDEAAEPILAPDAAWQMMAPLDRLHGREAIVEGAIRPLRAALRSAHRRDLVLLGGTNRRAAGGEWVAAVLHIVGTHDGPLWGVAPSGRLAMLRGGEFHRIGADGRIAESRIILDLPDLMRQAGRSPFPPAPGAELTWPGPATQDGICPAGGDGAASLDVVERMLGDLHRYDPRTGASAGQTGAGGAWADGMLWWGPGGIGSNHLWDGFVRDHRAGFLHAFPDRKGGDHFCRIGDGAYAAVSGWPSMTMTHRGDYLGTPATHRALTLRVMDFYRIHRGRIAENWVLLDYVDLWRQMGRDLLA